MTFEQIFAIFRRALPIVAIGMIGLGLIGLIVSLASPRIYQSTARVIVEAQVRPITSDPDVVERQGQRDPSAVDTEVQVLESSAVAARVVRDARLQSDPEFGGDSFDQSVRRFAEALSISRVGETELIDIKVESRSPQRAAQLANRTAEAYMTLERERKRRTTLDANRLLRARVADMAGQVRRAEAAVQQFRVGNNLLSVNGTTLAEQTSANISDRLAAGRAAERAALAELAAARSAGVPLDLANAQASLGTLRAQQAGAMQEMSAAQGQFGPSHPRYIAAARRLAEINQAVEAETQRARAGIAATQGQRIDELEARAAAATNLRRSLETSAGANAAGLASNSRAATRLADLERQAAALRSTYETYLQRYQQTLTQLGTEQSKAELIAAGTVPERPYKPSTLRNVLFGLLAGLAAGIAISTSVILFESHFSTAAQVEEELDVEGLPSLPTAGSAGLSVGRADTAAILAAMIADPTSAFAEMHKSLVGALDRPVDGRPNRVVAVTSALPKEGKTTAVLCLATAAAFGGRRVLLIDCDQRRRGVTRAAASGAEQGLHEVLVGGAAWRGVLAAGPVPGVDLLPASPVQADQVDLFGLPAFATLLAAVRDSYDLVLLDCAPVLPIVDTRLIVGYADSVLLVCRWRSTARRAVAAALGMIGRTGAPIAGVTLTRVDLKALARFGYGDPTFYYRSYKDYYGAPA
ncbi:GumC family protein [Sphingomonas jatrophae]|uniref:non-specific protein-tyrosine kinase n=1 Tax=Sphingomonas jatrophae TaxID=1166337 RepID=A0A1I6MBP6_9SPHN|nr:AAA family ATPase [Sphingomonas jatrophae]SFS13115.1 capsular exopolysaccharide family [Sphingomonas jatrophae]